MLKRIVVGKLLENCYLLERENQVLIIDPGDEFEKIKEAIGDKQVVKILITHEHFDHIGAVRDIIKEYKVEVLSFANLEEKDYQVGPFSFTVIRTPGHTRDSVTYYFQEEGLMFVGDFVFQGDIGRCDLPTGDFREMQKSIQKIRKYDDAILLYPGHGESSTLGCEKRNNPYF